MSCSKTIANMTSEDCVTFTRSISLAESLPLYQEVFFVGIVCMAQFMSQAGLSQTLISHLVGQSFGIENEPGQLSWVVSAFGLTIRKFILIACRLGNLLGYKPMVVFGFVWFGIWSVICSLIIYSRHIFFIVARPI
jgi:MFS family permease